MRKFLMLQASVLVLAAGTGLALASDDDDYSAVKGDNWMTTAQITEKYTAEGYDVRQIKVEGDGYEMYAIDADGKRVEGHVDPLTGELHGDSDD